MLNVHLSYKSPSSWRILFCLGRYPRQFSCLKKFRDLVFSGGGFHKGIIIQLVMTPTGVLPNVQSLLRRKGDVTGASVHAPIQSNSTYVHTVSRSIYETRWPKHPHFPIHRYQWLPLGPHTLVSIHVRAWYCGTHSTCYFFVVWTSSVQGKTWDITVNMKSYFWTRLCCIFISSWLGSTILGHL